MANQVTRLSDLQIPTNFGETIAEASVTKSALFTSGVVVPMEGLAISKGSSLPIPFLKPLAVNPQTLADGTSIETRKLGTGKQIGVVTSRGDGWAVNELAAAYTGDDLLGYIGSQVANYWAEVYDNQVIATLEGAVASEVIPVHDISAETGEAAVFSTKEAIKAQYKLGDARSKLAILVCHSDVAAKIEELNLNTSRTADSDGNSVLTYRGMRVVECDKLVAETGVYTAFMLALGAFGFANGLSLTEFEVARKAAAGEDEVFSRSSYVLHPMGLSNALAVSAAGASPTDEQLAADGAWTKAFETNSCELV
jgi:hypothetical protein